MEDFVTKIFVAIGVLVVLAAFGLLFAFPIKWCWNYAVVPIWELPAITWGQAWCLNLLAACLIRSQQTNNNK